MVIETPPESAVVCLGIPSALFYNCLIVRKNCAIKRNRLTTCYLTAFTIASNAWGSFIARSAITLRFRTIPLALSLPINCE